MANEQDQNKEDTVQKKREKDESAATPEASSVKQSNTESSTAESVKDTAQGFYDQAKNTAGQAYGLATEKAASTLEEQKTNLTSGLTDVADSIRQVGENLRGGEETTGVAELTAKYGDTVARQIEQVSSYFERKDVREMVGDVEEFARRNPAIFVGGAFVLGILAARFLKSSSPRELTKGQGQSVRASRKPSGSAKPDKARTATNPS